MFLQYYRKYILIIANSHSEFAFYINTQLFFFFNPSYRFQLLWNMLQYEELGYHHSLAQNPFRVLPTLPLHINIYLYIY